MVRSELILPLSKCVLLEPVNDNAFIIYEGRFSNFQKKSKGFVAAAAATATAAATTATAAAAAIKFSDVVSTKTPWAGEGESLDKKEKTRVFLQE